MRPTEMHDLDRPDCLPLLAASGIGRLVVGVAEWETPVIRPVRYVFDESSHSPLIRSGAGPKLHALLRSAGHKGSWIWIRANTVSGSASK